MQSHHATPRSSRGRAPKTRSLRPRQGVAISSEGGPWPLTTTPEKRSGRNVRLRRAIRAVLLAPVLLWALYCVAAQALLWTPLLRKLINAQGPTVHLEYAFAWSVWPGIPAPEIVAHDWAIESIRASEFSADPSGLPSSK